MDISISLQVMTGFAVLFTGWIGVLLPVILVERWVTL